MKPFNLAFRLIACCCFLLSVCFAGKVLAAESQRSMFAAFRQTQYNSSNGMPSDEANTIIQSRDGYLWIGSYSGLMRFNGQQFQAVKDVKDQVISRVRCLYEDSRHRLWIGTTNDSAYCYENGLVRQSDVIHATNQRAIAEDKEGRIYFGTAEGVIIYDDRQADKVIMIDDPHLKNHMTVSLASDLDGRIWGVTYDGDVFLLKGANIVAYFPRTAFNKQFPKFVFCDHSGTMYLATSGNTVLRIDSRVGEGSSPTSLKFTEFSTDVRVLPP